MKKLNETARDANSPAMQDLTGSEFEAVFGEAIRRLGGCLPVETMAALADARFPLLTDWVSWRHLSRCEHCHREYIALRSYASPWPSFLGRLFPSTPAPARRNDLLGSVSSIRVRPKWRLAGLALPCVAAMLVAVAALAVVREFVNRSATASRRSAVLIRDSQLARIGARQNGWSDVAWSNAVAAWDLRGDQATRNEAAAVLAGLDARLLYRFPDVAGGSAAFADDGRLLVSGAGGSPAQLVHPNGVREELPITSEGVVCWSVEGVPLHFAAGRNSCVLREAKTKLVLCSVPLFAGERLIRAGSVLATTSDGTRLAAALENGSSARIVVWDAASRAVLGELSVNLENGGSADGSSSDTKNETSGPLSAPTDSTAQSTNVPSTRTRQGYPTALVFSPDGLLLAVGNSDGTIGVYAVPGLEKIATLRNGLRRAATLALAFAADRVVPYETASSPKRWLLAAGDQGGELIIWDISAGQPRAFCRGSPHNVQAIAIHPDGLIASTGRGEVRLWDISTGNLLLRLTGQGSDGARALAFSHDGKRLVCGTKRGFSPPTVDVWSLQPQGRGIALLRGLGAAVRQVWWSRDGQRLAALADNWQLAVWEPASGELRWIFEAPQGALADNAAAAFHPDGDRLAFATGREARLYNLADGRVMKSWRLPHGLADQMQFDPQGRLLHVRREAPSGRSTPTLWRLRDLLAPDAPAPLQEQTDSDWVTFSTYLPPQADFFLVVNSGPAGTRRVLKAFDVSTGRQMWERPTERFNMDVGMLWDATGRWFAYTPDHDHYQLLDLLAGKPMGILKEGGSAISPSGEQFASFDNRGCLVFDRAGQARGLSLGVDWNGTSPPFFSPDGKLLAWGTSEGTVLVADLQQVRARLNALESR